MRALLIEDDDKVGAALAAALDRHGIGTQRVNCGRPAMALIPNLGTDVDIVLLDLGLPDIDGTTVCQAIRRASDVPIIVVTGRAETGAPIQSLRHGADDYLLKPFDARELLARIHAVLRRCSQADRAEQVVHRGDVTVDLARLTVTVAGQAVALSTKELRMLTVIAAERGEVCSRDRLIAEIWGRPWPGAASTLNVHVATLRAKLGRPHLVETIRGIGYRLCGDPDEPVTTAKSR